MKRSIFTFLAAISWAAYGADGEFDIPYDEFYLDNGLRVIVHEDRKAPIIATTIWYHVGSKNETPGRTGFAHLFEHLMFKETTSMEDGEFDRVMERLGGQVNASTWADWTFYRTNLPTGNLDTVARMEADRMRNLVINEAQLNSEREVVANERRFRVDNSPQGTIEEELSILVFPHHPYGWPTGGWMKDIQAITVADCRQFYDTYYAPNNATIIVVGDFASVDALRTIRRDYGAMEPRSIPEEAFTPEPPQTEERRKRLELALGVEKLVLGFRMPSLQSPDHVVVDVINAILLDGESSRAYKRLVEKEDLATEVFGWIAPWQYEGIFMQVVALKPGISTDSAEPVLLEELDRMAREPVPADELAKAKNRVETRFLTDLKTANGKAAKLGHYQTTTGDYAGAMERLDRLRAVKASDVQRVAAALFAENNRSVVIGVPQSEEAP